MILNILTYPNKALRKKTFKVKEILSPATQEFLDNLKETMLKADGSGLAARQVGHDENIFVINANFAILSFVNLRIIYRSFKKSDLEEGCLSVPKVHGIVTRSESIIASYYDELGQFHIKKFNGLTARIIQHEYDHNQGILFIDKVHTFTTNESLINHVKE